MSRILIHMVGGAFLIGLGAGLPIFGQTITFSFNSLTGYSNTAGNQETSLASQLQSQLRSQILAVCPTCSVSSIFVTPTNGTGAVIDKTYTGDGNVVGPTSGASVMPETLGDTPYNATLTSNSQYNYSTLHTEGFTNQFLSNTNDSSTQQANEISFQFSGLTVTGASFNYEIFPDGTAQQPPDFTFEAGNNTSGTDNQIVQTLGVTPANGGSDGSSTHSTDSGAFTAATSQQYIGNWSGTFASSTELDFVDWPATIGIDNLSITVNLPPSGVPEPGSFVLLGTLALGTLLIFKRRARSAE